MNKDVIITKMKSLEEEFNQLQSRQTQITNESKQIEKRLEFLRGQYSAYEEMIKEYERPETSVVEDELE
ncbi:MAG: hypothetical protein ACOCP8_00815 [archaeon]